MRDTTKRERHDAIAEAAYAVLAEKGYAGASMLTIAKRARASNETLYRWYGDKTGLFGALVRDNAEGVREILSGAVETEGNPIEVLERVGPILLEILLGDRAILLNRAAAADPTGELGAAVAEGGRQNIVPLIAALMARLAPDDRERTRRLSETWVSLLVGDQQIRRVIGVMARPSRAEISQRAAQAHAAFLTLLDAED